VRQPLGVRRGQGLGHLAADGGGLLGVERAAGQQRGQALPGRPLDAQEPGVGDGGRHPGRGGEPGRAQVVERDGLDEHGPAQDVVDGLPGLDAVGVFEQALEAVAAGDRASLSGERAAGR
jgi:hypothetical protein